MRYRKIVMNDEKPLETGISLDIPECGNGTFPYRHRSGTEPSYTCKVPTDKYYIGMIVGGGSGGYGTNQVFESGGPGGGVIAGFVPVIPGEILSIYVGQGAQHSPDPMGGYAPGGRGGGAPSMYMPLREAEAVDRALSSGR